MTPPTITATLVAAVAILLGLLLSPEISRHYAIFHWIPLLYPPFIGILPATQSVADWRYTFEEVRQTDLTGQVALVTGANSGIGYQIARALSRQGAAVYLGCRNPQRCFRAADDIRRDELYSGAPVSPLIFDLSSLKSIKSAGRSLLNQLADVNQGDDKVDLPVLDMLFLNAGIFSAAGSNGGDGNASRGTLPLTDDGIETVYATNVVGHHLLYRLMEPALRNAPMARVVSTSSLAGILWTDAGKVPSTLDELNRGKLSPINAFTIYGRSKLAQVAWTKALTRRLAEDQNSGNIYVNTAHPGAVRTEILGKNKWIPRFLFEISLWFQDRLLWSSEEGALTDLYLGLDTKALKENKIRGKYFHPQAVEVVNPYAEQVELQESVWTLCEQLVMQFI